MLAAVAALAAFAPGPVAEAARPAPQAIRRPAITRRFIPISAQRRRDTAAYAKRHYGISTTSVDPRAVVIHFTANGSVQETWNVFAPNVADPELRERPGTCAQFVIARNGRIVQLTPVTFLCRHTVGLNWAAIGIEHVGFSDAEVLGNEAQMKASIRLTRWLRCTHGIQVRDVIGHAESLSSRFHRERVESLRTQTHGDFARPAMQRYRALVRDAGC